MRKKNLCEDDGSIGGSCSEGSICVANNDKKFFFPTHHFLHNFSNLFWCQTLSQLSSNF